MYGHALTGGGEDNVSNPVEKGQDLYIYTAKASCQCLVTLKDLQRHYSALDVLIGWSEWHLHNPWKEGLF